MADPKKYQDYTADIDRILGGMSASDRAAIEAFTRSGKTLNRGGTPDEKAVMDKFRKEAIAAFVRNGYSEADATAMSGLAYNVRRFGGDSPDDLVKNDGATFFKDSATIDQLMQGAGQGGNKDDITAKINAFITGLNIPDPDVSQMLGQRAQSAATTAAGRAGLGGSGAGGLSGYGQQAIAGGLGAKYTMERKALQGQGLNILNNRDLGLGQLEQGYLQMQGQQADAKWAAQQNQNQAIGSAVGMGLGTVAGAYFGMPQLGQVGAQVGGGFGGMAGGGQGPSYQPSSRFSGGSSLSGGRGTGY